MFCCVIGVCVLICVVACLFTIAVWLGLSCLHCDVFAGLYCWCCALILFTCWGLFVVVICIGWCFDAFEFAFSLAYIVYATNCLLVFA